MTFFSFYIYKQNYFCSFPINKKPKKEVLMKKLAWAILAIIVIPIIAHQVYVVYDYTFFKKISLEEIAKLVLLFELLLASLTAYGEKGHFPVRYLLLYIISALSFNLSLEKNSMDWYVMLVHVISIILFSITYIWIKITENKNKLLK